MKCKCMIVNIFMICTCLSSWGQQSSEFTLKGNVFTPEYDGLYIYLTRMDVIFRDKDQKLDSALISNGHFSFKYHWTGEPFVASLALPPKDLHFEYGLPECLCIVERGEVKLDYTTLGVHLNGGVLNQRYDDCILSKSREIKEKNNILIAQRDSLEKLHSLSIEEMDRFNQRIQVLYQTLSPVYIKFVSDYIKTEVGAFFFFYYPESFYSAKVFDNLQALVDESYRRQAKLKEEREKEAIKHWKEAAIMTDVGHPFRDFKCKDIDGKDVNLSDYTHSGHVTLVDFWASWCMPCIQELSFLKSLYKSYHRRGLNIVSVSLDTKRKAWGDAVKRHQIPWTQISDLKGWNGTITKDYAISAIPFIILIDQKGKIAVRNLHDNKLENAIKKLLETGAK